MHTLAARQFQFNPKNRNMGYYAAPIGIFLAHLSEIQYPEPRFDLQLPQSVTTDRLVRCTTCSGLQHIHHSMSIVYELTKAYIIFK